MKSPFWPAAAILAGLIATGTANAATTYTWRFVVSEEETKAPVEGVTVDFTLTDGRNSRRTQLKCVTARPRVAQRIVESLERLGILIGTQLLN